MSDFTPHQLVSAIQEFRMARWRATLEEIWTGLTGQPGSLLAYEEVREALGARETAQRALREIPLAAIVGSVGRYTDFTRGFLPLVEEDERRWAQVWAQMGSLHGLPPIEVYQIGDVYFVRDGNHRVSVARQQGFSHIEAYVTEMATAVPLSSDDRPDDLIIKARYARFLERSQLDSSVPDMDLTMSAAGNYRVLEEQIWRHKQWLEQQSGTEIAYPAAARRWYEEVYWPVVQVIRQRGILRDFPDRTETDLYVWMIKHQERLAERLGWSVDAETAVLDLADAQTPTSRQRVQRLGQKLRAAMTPDALEAGPTVGEWRASWFSTHRQDRLFSHILVALDGQDAGWNALQQAILIAQREEGKLFGVHVVNAPEARHSAAALAVKAEFERRCRAGGVPGEISVTTGPTTGTICYRARWTDLVVVSLSHPPGPQPVDRLSSQFGQLVRRCPRPVLAVPRTHAVLDRLLLAYDGSPKAKEALFVSAYLAAQWQARLTVVVGLDKKVTGETAAHARAYLEAHGVQAHYVVEKSAPAPLILAAAREQDCGLLLMGGYGRHPVMEIVVGSVVDEALRTRNRPVLICR